MKKRYLIFLIFLLPACGSSLKRSVTNFRAHYNGLYNAERNFEAGYSKIRQQPAQIDPDQPVRVHQALPRVGAEDFQKAINKSAEVLRKFPDSKWTDDALFLIGRAYYYRQEYFLALQKFEELYQISTNPEYYQEAVLWKARTMLDLQQYEEGISYLKEMANGLVKNKRWYTPLYAEAHVLLGEHYAMLSDWEDARKELALAMPKLEGRQLKARTFFLYGQVLQHLEEYGEAYYAFSQVPSLFPKYEYIYWADIFKGRVARQQGNLDLAASIYTSMLKDDKNFDRRSEIRYELARTEEAKGNYADAEQLYRRAIHPKNASAPQRLKAKTYYRLAKVYGEGYKNFRLAAAYYDSSSQVARNYTLPANENPRAMASAYSEYLDLKQRESRADSLLWLGSLSQSRFDSVLAIIRQQRLAEFRREVNSKQAASNILTNIEKPAGENDSETANTGYGFLNYKNSRMVAESRQQFIAVWGSRPLVDNWRRVEVINTISVNVQGGNEQEIQPKSAETVTDRQLKIDVTDVPATATERLSLKKEALRAQYELGNLFFFTLNRADSAKKYFKSIIHSGSDDELAVKSMYTLYQIYETESRPDSAKLWSGRILDAYPASVYARQLKPQPHGLTTDVRSDTTRKLRQSAEAIARLSAPDTSLVKAQRYRRLALANRSSDMAPYIYYRAIREYIKTARRQTDSTFYNRYFLGQVPAKDSLSALDNTLLAGGRKQQPRHHTPFKGAYWDSVRTAIAEYDTTFSTNPYKEQLKVLQGVLSGDTPPKRIPTCEELGVQAKIRLGMDAFLSKVTLPESLSSGNLSGTITYWFLIADDGSVLSYHKTSGQTLPVIQQAYEKAFDEQKQMFEPLTKGGHPVQAGCEVTFPVKN